MECYNCSTLCDVSDSNNKNQGIKLENGKIICLPCHEVLDFMTDKQTSSQVTSVTQPKATVIQPKTVNPVKKEVMITCLKCKNKFSGRNCVCGFKNPLFR